MMSIFLVVVVSILVAELVFRFRNVFRKRFVDIARIAKDSVQTIRSKVIEDSSKEAILKQSSVNLFLSSLILCGLALLTLSPFWIVVTINKLNEGGLLQFALSQNGILVSILSSVVYVLARKLF